MCTNTLGNLRNQLIDGAVQLRQHEDSLGAVLSDWAPDRRGVADLRAQGASACLRVSMGPPRATLLLISAFLAMATGRPVATGPFI